MPEACRATQTVHKQATKQHQAMCLSLSPGCFTAAGGGRWCALATSRPSRQHTGAAARHGIYTHTHTHIFPLSPQSLLLLFKAESPDTRPGKRGLSATAQGSSLITVISLINITNNQCVCVCSVPGVCMCVHAGGRHAAAMWRPTTWTATGGEDQVCSPSHSVCVCVYAGSWGCFTSAKSQLCSDSTRLMCKGRYHRAMEQELSLWEKQVSCERLWALTGRRRHPEIWRIWAINGKHMHLELSLHAFITATVCHIQMVVIYPPPWKHV